MRIVTEISNDPNDIIVIHKEKIYSFTVEEILEKIEDKPVYVAQSFEITNEIKNKGVIINEVTISYDEIIKRLKVDRPLKTYKLFL